MLEAVGDLPAYEQTVGVVRPGGGQARRPPVRAHRSPRWHGAAPARFMTHLAMLAVDDDGNPATWGDHVSDEYAAAPPIDREPATKEPPDERVDQRRKLTRSAA